MSEFPHQDRSPRNRVSFLGIGKNGKIDPSSPRRGKSRRRGSRRSTFTLPLRIPSSASCTTFPRTAASESLANHAYVCVCGSDAVAGRRGEEAESRACVRGASNRSGAPLHQGGVRRWKFNSSVLLSNISPLGAPSPLPEPSRRATTCPGTPTPSRTKPIFCFRCVGHRFRFLWSAGKVKGKSLKRRKAALLMFCSLTLLIHEIP